MAEEKKEENENIKVERYPGEEDEGNFGYCGCEPRWIQFGNNPFGFSVVFSVILLTQGMLANGIFNVIITTLEQRFGFSSWEVSIITISYDIGYFTFTLFVTFYATHGHRPRLMAIGSIFLGTGSLLFAVPHFATGVYDYGEATTNLCQENKTEDCSTDDPENLHAYLALFIFAMVLQGIGCIPFYTVSYAILEDSLTKKKSPLYIGWANAMSLLGPVIGYILGGYILTIYVDFHVPGVDLDDKSIYDPRWVGAWYLGHLLTSALCFIAIMIPMFGFPKQFPGSAKIRASRESEVHAKAGAEITEQKDFGKSIKDMPQAILALIKNPTFFFTVAAGCSEAFVISGFTAFLPKVIENLYNTTPTAAALYAGVVAIPGGVFGNIIAAIIVSKMNMRTPKLLVFCIICVLAVCVLAPIGLYNCGNPSVAGVTVSYSNPDEPPPETDIITVCNSLCSCSGEYFNPICQGNFSYFSPCHAGCSSYNTTSGRYYDCGCEPGKELKGGFCDDDACDAIVPFIIVFFVIVLLSFAISTPAQLVILRCVPDSQRSFAIGVQVFLMRAFGSIPGPLVFGAIFDATCILWEELDCDEGRGSCYIYDSTKLAASLMGMAMGFKLLSTLLFYLAMRFYVKVDLRKEEKIDFKSDEGSFNSVFVMEEQPDSDGVSLDKHPIDSFSRSLEEFEGTAL